MDKVNQAIGNLNLMISDQNSYVRKKIKKGRTLKSNTQLDIIKEVDWIWNRKKQVETLIPLTIYPAFRK